jgi:hypothetical protein
LISPATNQHTTWTGVQARIVVVVSGKKMQMYFVESVSACRIMQRRPTADGGWSCCM